MTKGPAPQPTILKKLRGNPGKRALNKNEPKPTGKPTCPAWLSKYAKSEWRYITVELERCGLLTKIDRQALVNYCEAVADFRTATEHLQREEVKLVYQTANGNYNRNPWMIQKEKSGDRMHKYLCEFGMTPSSRTRIKVEKPDNEPNLAEMIFQAVAG